MTNAESSEAAIAAWFTQRLPQEWTSAAPPGVTVDREEITVVLTLTAPETAEGATDAEKAEGLAGLVARFREDSELFTHLAVPVMTRLRQPERQVLDTLVDAGVARSRAHALAWCVRLVGQNTASWLGDLRSAMERVEQVRKAGPATGTATTPEGPTQPE
jgi:hypothetical protein